MPIVLIIAMNEQQYDAAVEKYKKAGGIYETKHIQGVKATQLLRDNHCSKICRVFCFDSLVGCYLAHQNAWLEAQKHDITFIYEQDVVFKDNFKEEDVNPLLKKYDIVALGTLEMGKKKFTWIDHLLHLLVTGCLIDVSQKNQYPLKWMYGCHAYAINKNTSNKLIDFLPKIENHVDQQITKLLCARKLNGVGIWPCMVQQGAFSKSTQLVNKMQSAETQKKDAPNLQYQLNYSCFRFGNSKFSVCDCIIFLVLLLVSVPVAILFFVVMYFCRKIKT